MVRQGRSVALVVAFLIGCAVLLMAGASGVKAEASQQNDQEHTEATNNEQGRSPEATTSEEARCEGTREINVNLPARFTTNDLPGCPKGGPLLGTDKGDLLAGEEGDDEVRGLGGSDDVMGGPGNDVLYGGSRSDAIGGYDGDDVIYGGPGDDGNLVGHGGNDVIYGGPGDDTKLDVASQGELGNDGQRDELYCGEGRDTYYAEEIDHVASSCEVKLGNSVPGFAPVPICTKSFEGDVCRMPDRTSSASASGFPAMRSLVAGGGPDILPLAAALLLGSGILTYAILRRR